MFDNVRLGMVLDAGWNEAKYGLKMRLDADRNEAKYELGMGLDARLTCGSICIIAGYIDLEAGRVLRYFCKEMQTW